MKSLLKRIAEFALHDLGYLDYLVPVAGPTRQDIDKLFVEPQVADATGELFGSRQTIDKHMRLTILGPPGAGKTTLLKFYAVTLAQAFLKDTKFAPCPLFFRAPDVASLASGDTLVDRLGQIVCQRIGKDDQADQVRSLLRDNRFVIVIDGIDEVDSARRYHFVNELGSLGHAHPDLKVLASSRPSGLSSPIRGFVYFHLEPFDIGSIRALSRRLSAEQPEYADRFLQAIQSHLTLYALASNPLLLHLLWQVFRSRGMLPDNLTSLYADCTDFLLSTWERAKGVSRVSISLRAKQSALEQIGYELLIVRAQNSASRAEIRGMLGDFLEAHGERRDADEQFLDELLTTGILLEISPNQVCFIHLTFLEYYSARAVSSEPARVVGMVDRFDLHNVVVMACGLLPDVGPIIEAAVEKRQILLAAKCVSHGRTRNRRLTQYVISSFIHEVGEGFVSQLIDSANRSLSDREPVDVYDDLLALLERTGDAGLASHDKGRLFEEFSSRFFGQCFSIVRRDYNTENGEIDLVLEMKKSEPFWADYGGEVLVECKNWNTDVPLEEVGSFAHKVAQVRGIQLAFFVSGSGFTEDAIRTLRNQAGNASSPLIVPITGSKVRRALIQRDDFAEFLKDAIRDMKYLRKY